MYSVAILAQVLICLLPILERDQAPSVTMVLFYLEPVHWFAGCLLLLVNPISVISLTPAIALIGCSFVYELLRIEPVYWSMWACLLKEAFKKLDLSTSDVLGFLRQGPPKLLMLRDQYFERHGMNPCPYILLKQTWS